jgi:ABC-type glycerol-3-phosphate transport system permease component
MCLPGLSSTALILIIFAWNEAFWSINLTSANAAPLTAFIASYSSPEGLFWAKLSAASLLAVAPIMGAWLAYSKAACTRVDVRSGKIGSAGLCRLSGSGEAPQALP